MTYVAPRDNSPVALGPRSVLSRLLLRAVDDQHRELRLRLLQLQAELLAQGIDERLVRVALLQADREVEAALDTGAVDDGRVERTGEQIGELFHRCIHEIDAGARGTQ